MPLNLNTRGVCCDAPLEVQPALAYHFDEAGLNPAIDSFGVGPLSVQRVTSATYKDSRLTLRTAGPDEARFYHDENGARQGLLIETSVANAFTNSATLGGFGGGGVTRDAAAGFIGPDSITQSVFMRETNSTGSHFLVSSLGSKSAGASAFSVFARPGPNRSKAQLQFRDANDFNNFAVISVDLNAGTIISSQVGGTFSDGRPYIEKFRDGWYRFGIAAEMPEITVSALVNVLDSGGNVSFQGSDDSGIHVFGAQFERANAVTSYIPTGNFGVTRGLDGCDVDIPALGSPEGFALFADYHEPQGAAAANARIASLSDPATGLDDQVSILDQASSGSGAAVNGTDGGVSLFFAGTAPKGRDVRTRVGVSVSAGRALASVDGAALAVTDPPSVPTVTNLSIGQAQASPGNTTACQPIRRVWVFDRHIDNQAALDALTSA